ncbi:MAG: acyl-CoA dehydrogenase family protein [Deltaproteobacteria bacterium]|nr:acyl-CoA dehydrogenase family protein [Deltaproteobacteria bacterium]MCL5792600.1 acyl-CoA dehydrogenase family protein [Deltaproteobacteria bacterium]
MDRNIFSEEHEIFRQGFKRFLEREVVPHQAEWKKNGMVSKDVWKKTGSAGYLCPWVEEKYGGSGVNFLYSVVVMEEMANIMESGFAINLHSDIVVPYIATFGNEEQKQRWLPGCVRGEIITAVAMTEPGTGSDLQAIRTTAVRDGDHYIVNGQKTFISNGQLCDLVVTACKTNPKADPPYTGMSLIVIEDKTPGFEKGKKLEKIGMKSQDTSEMYFSDCKVPVKNMLGVEGEGFFQLMQKLQQERLVSAIMAQAGAEKAIEETIKYTKTRTAFGKPISKFQNTRFKLAEMATEIELGRTFVDRLIQEHIAGVGIVKETCMAKWWITEMLKRTIDQCLQLFGGYGYMLEYPIAQAYIDARVQTIFAGTTEIMKEIIGKQMGL